MATVRVTIASLAAAGVITVGLAVQMALGHDPALGTGQNAKAPSSGAGAQAAPPPSSVGAAPAPAPDPVVTTTS